MQYSVMKTLWFNLSNVKVLKISLRESVMSSASRKTCFRHKIIFPKIVSLNAYSLVTLYCGCRNNSDPLLKNP